MAIITASAAGGNSNTTGAWAGGVIPGAGDDVKLDATSGNVTLNAAFSCLTFDCTGYTGTLTHNSGITLTVAGSLFKLVAGMTYTLGSATSSALAFTQSSAGVVSITTGGKTLGNVTTASGLTVSSATYQLQGTTTVGATASWIHNAGTLDSNSQAWSVGLFQSNNSNTRTITLGSSSVTLTGGVTSTVWNTNTVTGLTFTAGTSTITLTGAFTGAGGTFGGGGVTFNNLTSTATGTWLLNGGNTFATLTISGTQTVNFRRSTTTTVQNFVAWGSSGNVITLQSDLAATQWTLSCSSRVYIWCNWLSLQDAKTAGTTQFFAGGNSTSVSNNTGWTFSNWSIPAVASSVSSSTATVTASTKIPVASSSSTSTDGLALRAPTVIPLSTARSTSSSSALIASKTFVGLQASHSVSASILVVGFGYTPSVIATYMLKPGLNLRGLTLGFAGASFAQGEMFDVIAALALTGTGKFSVCDNAIKDALNRCPFLLLTSN